MDANIVEIQRNWLRNVDLPWKQTRFDRDERSVEMGFSTKAIVDLLWKKSKSTAYPQFLFAV